MGFTCVSRNGNKYKVAIKVRGIKEVLKVHLGPFATAQEVALQLARHDHEAKAEEAAGAGSGSSRKRRRS